MKNKKLLFVFVATVLLASNCLEGMKKVVAPSDLPEGVKIDKNGVVRMHYYDKGQREKLLHFCKNNQSKFYRIKFGKGFYKLTTGDVNLMIEKCKNIIGLDLSWCVGKKVDLEKITWRLIKKLWYLNLRHLSFSKELLKMIFSVHKDIKKLNLYSHHVRYRCPLKDTNLLDLTDLRSINIYDSYLTAEYLNKMGLKFKNLEKLYFTGDSHGSSLILKNVKWGRFKNLKELRLSGAEASEDDFLEIKKHCRKLKKLKLPAFEFTRKTLSLTRFSF